jgi:hypothetical protein
MSLTGKVVFEGNEKPAKQMQLWLARSDGSMGAPLSIAQDGTLSVDNGILFAGRYRIQIQNAPGFYLKSIEANGAKFSDGTLEIPASGAVQLSIVLAKGTSRIDGLALRDGKPFAGAMVLLIPQSLARPEFIPRDQSDSDGTFTLNEVLPGQYTVIAIDDGRELEYQNSSVIRPYLSQGQPVEAPVGNGTAIKVNVQDRRKPVER